MRRLLLALGLGIGLGTAAWAEVPEPAGYRGEPYRAPVPATLSGALVLDDAAAHALWWAGAAFVDVLPAPPRPADLPEGTLWRDAPHDSIPAAIWLPNTGYAGLDPVTRAYFLAGLETATGGDRDAPVVLFCARDCWMSWNAGRRALAQGYTRVAWYPGGIDDWRARGWPVARIAAHRFDE